MNHHKEDALIRRRCFRWTLCLLVLLLAVAVSAAGRADTGSARGDLGVSLAMQGECARAESVFISMLSLTQGDSRALNNLGNLALLRDSKSVALAYYDSALRGEPADAGIHLNRATALMRLHDVAGAEAAARTAIRLAGSVQAAEALLGLEADSTGAGRAADRTALIAKDEIRTLLRRAAAPPAARLAPVDTSRSALRDGAFPRKPAAPQRPGGPRAADASEEGVSAAVLYWK
jgi:Flp pilus assembly protein TadD